MGQIRGNLFPGQESDCDSQQWARLTGEERIQLCLRQAEEADRLSIEADAGARMTYAELSQQWRMLADEIARAAIQQQLGRA